MGATRNICKILGETVWKLSTFKGSERYGKNIWNVVYFLLGISPASNCSWLTFRNPVSVPSSKPLKMELIQGSETSANYNLTPGKYPEENI